MTLRQKLSKWIEDCDKHEAICCNESSKYAYQIEKAAYIRVLCAIDKPLLVMPLSEHHQEVERQ